MISVCPHCDIPTDPALGDASECPKCRRVYTPENETGRPPHAAGQEVPPKKPKPVLHQPCRQCGTQISIEAKTCPHCGVSHPGMNAKTIGIGFGFILILALIWGGIEWAFFPSEPDRWSQVADVQLPMTLSHMVTKQVNGRFDYWFDLHNQSESMLDGELKITLVQSNGLAIPQDVFSTTSPIHPGVHKTFAMNDRVGLPAQHGDFGVVGFRWKFATEAGIVAEGEGRLSGKFSVSDVP